MTERIQHIIDEIREKSQAMHKLLTAEREKNLELYVEISELKEQLNQSKLDIEAKTQEIANLNTVVETTKNQVVEVPVSLGRKDEEIDELVKEIEYCISQLKK